MSLTSPFVWGQASGADLSVEYDSPQARVEASDVALSVLLDALAEKAEFRVKRGAGWTGEGPVSMHASDTPARLLRRLLREHDYVVNYRREGGTAVVDELILLGYKGEAPPIKPTAPIPKVGDADTVKEDDGESAEPSVAEMLAARAKPGAAARKDADAVADDAVDSNIFYSGGWGSSGDGLSGDGSQAQDSGGGLTEVPMELQDVLAETTRAAQQNVKALVEALKTAGDDMGQPQEGGSQ